METRTEDYEAAAALVAAMLARLDISKAEAGRGLGLEGEYARVRVSQLLASRRKSWEVLRDIDRDVIRPALESRRSSLPTLEQEHARLSALLSHPEPTAP